MRTSISTLARYLYHRRASHTATLLVMVLTLVLAACAAPAAPANTGADAGDAPAAAEEEATQGGTLVLTGHQEVAGLSPNFSGPSVQETAIRAIDDSLVLTDEFGEVQPLLAESYEVSDDGLTYTFNLHEGVLFHDGTELTSEDVQYTIDFYRDPEVASSIIGQFNGVGSVETPDDYTVVINMESVNAAFLIGGAQVPIVQSDYHAEVGEATYAQEPIGSGSFRLVDFNPAEQVLLEAYEDYFMGRACVDEVLQIVVPEPSVRAISLQTGDSDSALWPLLVEDSLDFMEDPNFTVITTITGGVKHIMLNNQHPALGDQAVRQALMYGLDRQRLIDDIWNGAAVLAHTNLSPKFPFYSLNDDPDAVMRYEYDPEMARQVLEDAGWVDEDGDGVREKDGTPLAFTITTITGDQARRPLAELAQQMWSEIGVDVELAEAPLASIQEGQRNGTLDASLYNWTYGSVDPDPSNQLASDGGQNWNNYSNERVDELIELGRTTVDPAERQPYYHEIQQIVAEEVPFIPLMYDEWYNVFSNRVQGLPENPTDGFPIYFNGMREWCLSE